LEEEMSKFNLEKAMAGAPVVTRGGQKAVIVNGVSTREDFGDFVAVVNVNGRAQVFEIWNDGRYYTTKGEESVYDLFMAPVKREGWVNVYKESRTSVGAVFKTEEEARATAVDDYVATVKIEWDE